MVIKVTGASGKIIEYSQMRQLVRDFARFKIPQKILLLLIRQSKDFGFTDYRYRLAEQRRIRVGRHRTRGIVRYVTTGTDQPDSN